MSIQDRDAVHRLRTYCREIKEKQATGQATEHSYRSALEVLIQGFGDKQVRVLNEPSQVACGAPDLIVEHHNVPVGHVECKDVGTNLNQVENDEQIQRYRKGLPNLILTDYLEFRWYVEGELRKVERLGRVDGKNKITFDEDGAKEVSAVFNVFFDANPCTVTDPRELARRMAAKARLLRESIEQALGQENLGGPLHEMLSAYRQILIGGLSESDFADMQAQTVAYGLFAARCMHDKPEPFTRQSAIFADTTPFLRDVFGRIAGPGIDPRIAWIVDDLALLLDRADMSVILTNFGRRMHREDPVVYFYEDFLSAYDSDLREVRGVYYTPEPVVSYIVKSIDNVLRDQFGCTDGLADIGTIEMPTEEINPRVLILDPAAGTGTFLCETVATIRKTIEDKKIKGAWPQYIRDHLMPRLFGFELLMAPYSICHLKLALEIYGTGTTFKIPEGQRLGVFLTNSLEEAHEGVTGALFAHEIAREAADANAVKREKPVMVVLGNPPYSGHAANKGKWITNLVESYKQTPDLKKPAKAKWLSDDYVKFLRFAQWRIEQTGEGILGFVTNHGYLDNPTFHRMRYSLMETFDEIYLLDLHGNVKKKERTPEGGKDDNVFDIQQGVAIGIFVKHSNSESGLAQVFHADLWGERETGIGEKSGKYDWLRSNNLKTTQWTKLSPKEPNYLYVPRDETLSQEYDSAWSIPEIFSPNGDPAPGIVTTHDQFAISQTQEELVARVDKFLDTRSEKEARKIWRLCSTDQWKYDRAKSELSQGLWREQIVQVLYRPFDVQWTVFDRNVAVHRRMRVMRHMLQGPNMGLCVGRAGQVVGSKIWDVVFVSKYPSDLNLFRRGGNCLFPLYTYAEKGGEQFGSICQPNINPDFIQALISTTGLEFVPDKDGDLSTTFGPRDIFHYIYAMLHSPEFRHRYADFIKSDFPRIPFTTNGVLLATLIDQGQRLVALHLMETDVCDMPTFPAVGSNQIDKVNYVPPVNSEEPGRVWINDEHYFEGVRLEVWQHTVGGYCPAKKWLEARKGNTLSYNDITHYCKVCGVLVESLEIMVDIDKKIASHGGWPIV